MLTRDPFPVANFLFCICYLHQQAGLVFIGVSLFVSKCTHWTFTKFDRKLAHELWKKKPLDFDDLDHDTIQLTLNGAR